MHARRCESGYAMAALLVAMAVMAIVLSTVMPVYTTVARREREAELVFRGEQYARAIALFQRKYGNALPPDVDVLIDQRFLRRKYKDPITGDDFRFMGPGSPELAQALSTTPQQALDAVRGRGAGSVSATPQAGGRAQGTPLGFGRSGGPTGTTGMPGGRGPLTAAGQAASAQAAGGIVAVASKSTETAFRLYNGKTKYNEWIFMAVAATTAAGGRGALAPGGRGGAAGGRGGALPGGRGGAQPGGRGNPPLAPGGTRGRGGFSPIGRP
jgi:type II secretory pathway pseudopilin PulG